MNVRRLLPVLVGGCMALMVSCDDDTPAVEYKTGGSIKGTITGTQSDGTTEIDESFNYKQYLRVYDGEGVSGYQIDADDGEVYISIFRRDINKGGYVYMNIYMDSESDTDPEVNFYLNYMEQTATERFVFSSSSSTSDDLTLSDFSFDSETGRVMGTFSIENSDNSSGNDATIEGTFDVTLAQLEY